MRESGTDRCRLLVGTSGYSYPEWVEAGFYPAGTKAGKMLSHYAEHFPVVELNFTWYQMPRAEALERQQAQVPDDFLFTAKLTRSLTHDIEPDEWRGQTEAFRHGVAPLLISGQLLAVLAQFPRGFVRSVANRRYLAELLDELEGLPLAVEFRHASWAEERVFAELERRGVTLVSVDAPELPGLFPSLAVVTNPELFYVRFHGRNRRGWGRGKQEQFDYDYDESELRRWLEERILPMTERCRRGAIFFNNHVRGQAVRNAGLMARLLAEHGFATTGG